MAEFAVPDVSRTDRLQIGPELVEPVWTTSEGLLRIRVANEAGDWSLELHGELDLSNAQALEREIRSAEASGDGSITIDLSGLDFMDSSGLHVILEAHHRSRLSSRLRLLKGPRAVQTVFRRFLSRSR